MNWGCLNSMSKMELFLEEEINFVLDNMIENEDKLENTKELRQEISDRIIESLYLYIDNRIVDVYYSIQDSK